MRSTPIKLFFCAAIAVSGFCSRDAGAVIIAQSGFNDVSGINADGTPNSPFALGSTVEAAGGSEPGWSGGWHVQQGGANLGFEFATAESFAAFEGDGGLAMQPGSGGTRALRLLATPQSRSLTIEQQVNFIGIGTLNSRPENSFQTQPFSVGPDWRITGPVGSRHFEVLDGTGNGLEENWENTGIAQAVGEWQKVTININVATQTWTFAVDSTTYNAPDPLGFLGQPTQINQVEYLSSTSGYIDSVVVSSVPEPSAAVAAVGGISALGLGLRRRRAV